MRELQAVVAEMKNAKPLDRNKFKVELGNSKKTPASNTLTDLIRAVIRMNATVQKSGTHLTRDMGITNVWWQTLGELFALSKRVMVSELARYMGLTRQAVQRLADDMARDCLLEFAENPGDARAMHLLVTETGRATYHKTLEREWQWTNAIATDFDAEQIKSAVALLEAITEKMIQRLTTYCQSLYH